MNAVTDWFVSHPWIAFIIIYVFLAYVYNKVFKVRRLPILKALIVYLMIGVGALILMFFQVDLKLPIIFSLAMVIILMLIVRIRYFLEGRKQPKL